MFWFVFIPKLKVCIDLLVLYQEMDKKTVLQVMYRLPCVCTAKHSPEPTSHVVGVDALAPHKAALLEIRRYLNSP